MGLPIYLLHSLPWSSDEGGAQLSTLDRQLAILDILSRERHATAKNLAEAFGVSERTIRSDIEELSCHFPIQTVRGRYGGGIRLEKELRFGIKLSHKQVDLLCRLRNSLMGDDLTVMDSILEQFAPSAGSR